MPKYADVSLPVSVDREFTYLIPPEIPLSVGVRVVVPLGRKFATGLVVGLPERSDVRGLKPIRTVLDASPIALVRDWQR
jgi:primosomal protein N' (replication factor Y)